MLEIAATIKRFEYFLLGKEFKGQTDIAKETCQGLDKVYECDKGNDENQQLISITTQI